MDEPFATEAAFRDSEERYRVLFEMESDAIFLIDNEAGQILEVNPAASTLYGYTRAELLAKRNIDLSAEPEDTWAATQEQRARVPVRYHRKKNGTVFPVEIAARHFVWRGRPAHLAAIRDITDRQRAADALAHRTRQLEAVRAVTAEIIRELELPTVLRLITERACALTGATAGDLDLWDDARQLLVPEVTYGHAAARPAAPRRLGEGAMGIVAQRREGLIINDYRTSGLAHPLTLAQTRITASLLEPLLYGDRLLGVLGVDHEHPGRIFSAQDQAALKLFAAEAAIAIENARLFHAELSRRAEVEAVQAVNEELARELDLATLLRLIHARALELVGGDSGVVWLWDAAAQVLIPQHWTGFGPWMADARIHAGEGVVGTVAARREGLLVNEFRTSPYAMPFWLERSPHVAVLAEPLCYGERLVGVITVSRNDPAQPFRAEHQRRLKLFAAPAAIAIENARLYASVRTQAAELEARVRDRTADLERANAQLRKMSQFKSEFLATMSHEIRTPLNSILGFAQLLREQTQDRLAPKQARYLAHILQSGEHLLQLISDILDLSTVEAGKIVLQLASLDVARALAEIMVVARGLAHKKAQQLAAEIASDLPSLRADPLRFKQICFNLLSNAVKYTPEGGRIALAAQPTPDGAYLELRVCDTGIGICPEDLPRVFLEFVRLATTRGSAEGGTGLGLSVTKRLVELHGGTIMATSPGAGRGSTFTVRLPFAGPAAPSETG